MGSMYRDNASNRLWQDYSDKTGAYAIGEEIMRIDVAQGDSQRIVLRPITDFVVPGATATAQWSLDGKSWDACPYYDPALGTYTQTGIFALGAGKPLLFGDLGNYFRIVANNVGVFSAPNMPNIIAGLTGDDGLIFGGSAGGGGGGGNTNLTQIKGTAVDTGAGASGPGTQRVIPASDSVLGATQSGSWTVASTQSGPWTVGAAQSGAWSVSAQLSAGTAVVGKVGIDQTTPGTTNKVSIGTDGVVGTSRVSTYTLRQSTITAGGTAQQWAPAVAGRTGFSFQNASTGDLFLLENAASATSASATNFTVKVPAGGYYYNDPGFVPLGIISVFGATTGQAFTGKDF